MNGKFQWTFFADCDLEDSFFDSLKEDYKEFSTWFKKKASEGRRVCIYREDGKILAMLYLKDETEELELKEKKLESKRRLKIGTLKIDNFVQNQRLGEGALGLSLWYWKRMKADEVYITTFDKQEQLISLLLKFGFEKIGENARGEGIYWRSKKKINYETPYTAFPYLISDFRYCGYIPVKDEYHDTLFPYSELAFTNQETEEIAAANGITKVFIATPSKMVNYYTGEPVFVYRIHTGKGAKKYKSVITSVCTIVRQIIIKENGTIEVSYEEFERITGNKSYFQKNELKELYQKKNLILLEMVYNGFFGSGHNVNYQSLSEHGLFECYPYDIKLDQDQFRKVLRLGGVDVRNFIID